MRHQRFPKKCCKLSDITFKVLTMWMIVEMATGTRPEAFFFIAVEKQRPFGDGVYMADQAMIDLGKQHAREDLNNIAEWKANDKFPGYSERGGDLTSKWMLPKEDGAPDDYQPIELY